MATLTRDQYNATGAVTSYESYLKSVTTVDSVVSPNANLIDISASLSELNSARKIDTTVDTNLDPAIPSSAAQADARDRSFNEIRSTTPECFEIVAGHCSTVDSTVDPAITDPVIPELTPQLNMDNIATPKRPPRPVEPILPNDWRVRLHLAPTADYLYKAPNPGILYPLRETNGIIFPYTPRINVQYAANYENYDLVHSNYKGYFYKNSTVQNLLVTATFTAQDTLEANYMLASLHFLRSATKMFYGQDHQRGMPPPIVFLTGLGEFHFKDHPCAITLVNYNLPNDVDYIPAGVPEINSGSDTERARSFQYNPGDTRAARLHNGSLTRGGKPYINPDAGRTPDADYIDELTKIYNGKTYVPTKIDIDIAMIPIQTRTQVSKEFSLKAYANGSLLKKGFW